MSLRNFIICFPVGFAYVIASAFTGYMLSLMDIVNPMVLILCALFFALTLDIGFTSTYRNRTGQFILPKNIHNPFVVTLAAFLVGYICELYSITMFLAIPVMLVALKTQKSYQEILKPEELIQIK